MTYYWTPQGYPQMTPQQSYTQVTPPAVTVPSGRPGFREESYIENIFRLNRDKPGTFYFSFEHAIGGKNTVAVTGYVEAAGRDHVILRETSSDHRFLFPMIYFDYAEFNEELAYFPQTP